MLFVDIQSGIGQLTVYILLTFNLILLLSKTIVVCKLNDNTNSSVLIETVLIRFLQQRFGDYEAERQGTASFLFLARKVMGLYLFRTDYCIVILLIPDNASNSNPVSVLVVAVHSAP